MASSKEQSTSTVWRERGNDLYRTVQEGLAPSLQASRLQDAINCYGRAISAAADDNDKSSACKNMAMAAWKMAKVKMDTKAKDKDIAFYFRESLKHFQDAKEYGQLRSYAWYDQLVVSSLSCWIDFHERVDGWDSEERISELEKFVHFLIHDYTKAQEYLEIADHYIRWAVTSLSDQDYQQALTLLAEATFPLNEAKRFGRADDRLNRECEMRLEDMHVQQCMAESIRDRIKGEQLLEYVVREEEVLNIDMVWEVIDLLRQAALLTRDRDLELEAMALSALGKVYHRVLKLKDRAKACLMKAIELANTMVPRNFSGEEWYEFARSTLEQYQQATLTEEMEKTMKEREEAMKLIETDLRIIQAKQRSMGKLEFLKYLYSTYPPRNPQHTLGEIPRLPEPSDQKKLYQKAVVHYHPDKVQESEHGAKWKALSAEICKILTGVYETYKIAVETPTFSFDLDGNDFGSEEEEETTQTEEETTQAEAETTQAGEEEEEEEEEDEDDDDDETAQAEDWNGEEGMEGDWEDVDDDGY